MKIPLRRTPPSPAPAPEQDALAFYSAETFYIPQGWWVYVLRELPAPGESGVFYVGQSDHLLSRLGRWTEVYPERLVAISQIKCRDQYQADVIEQALIDFYQPIMNTTGTAAAEARRAARRRAAPSPPGRGQEWHDARARTGKTG